MRGGIEAVIPLPVQHARDDHTAVDGGILGDLARGSLEGALQHPHAGALVAYALGFLLGDGIDTAD